jgi:hypothetical protein
MSDPTEALRRFISNHMEAAGLGSQDQLAAALTAAGCPTSQPAVSGYLGGSVVIPPDTVGGLVRVLGLDDAEELDLARRVRAVHVQRMAVRRAKRAKQGAA